MVKGTKINNGRAKVLILLAGMAILGFLFACAADLTQEGPLLQEEPVQQETGLFGRITQWNSGISDINGEVGHRLWVTGPHARCKPSGQWTANQRIISGTLPPGLDFEPGNFNIAGIPTERGHWVVNLTLENITCEGMNYDQCCGFVQELRFHITGTGKVNY